MTDRPAEARLSAVSWPWMLVISLLAGAAILLHSPLLSVKRIEVLGVVQSGAATRVAESGIGEGAILLWVDTDRVARAVAADPWVAAVRVDREWPDRLIVEVIEREPVAWIQGRTAWMRVAADGVVIDTAPQPTVELIQLAVAAEDRVPGAASDDESWSDLVAMARVLIEGVGPGIRIETLGSELWGRLPGYEVRFGHSIDLEDKARALVALLAGGIPAGSRVDVTSPSRPAVVSLSTEGVRE
jgi:cell division protein FtsQ